MPGVDWSAELVSVSQVQGRALVTWPATCCPLWHFLAESWNPQRQDLHTALQWICSHSTWHLNNCAKSTILTGSFRVAFQRGFPVSSPALPQNVLNQAGKSNMDWLQEKKSTCSHLEQRVLSVDHLCYWKSHWSSGALATHQEERTFPGKSLTIEVPQSSLASATDWLGEQWCQEVPGPRGWTFVFPSQCH